MWLKIVFDEEEFSKWPKNNVYPNVSISFEKTAPISNDNKTFRISPLFPLAKEINITSIGNTSIHFFEFQNSYRILGLIEKRGTKELISSTYFSIGLASVILITDDTKIISEFEDIISNKAIGSEIWKIENGKIQSIAYPIDKGELPTGEINNFPNYDCLQLTERAIIDEFIVTINLLNAKLQRQMPSEVDKINKLIQNVVILISELVYITELTGSIPPSLSEYSQAHLQDKRLNLLIRHQNLDRIIQINSALSYVSTQAFSGSIPILERRSLIRRNSLLGIGSAILALNNIARFIEHCFSRVEFSDVIINLMKIAPGLSGTEDLPNYDSNQWIKSSITALANSQKNEEPYFKLPYFSGRLGFRETEYSIAAAIQSITSGASLEWSLMTVTHEMLHGHVRKLISAIFYGDDSRNVDQLRIDFFNRFINKYNKRLSDEKLIDSIRAVIFIYCCRTLTHGSLSAKVDEKSNKLALKIPKDSNELWNILENENRNINEIFVHILDLNYFYASRLSVYIPLIWCSWVAVPHINSDLRQYILRSLLTIASTMKGECYPRFYQSVDKLKELLNQYTDTKLNSPVIISVLKILDDETILKTQYFHSFNASLIIVDLVTQIFISNGVRSAIFNDEFVKWEEIDNQEEASEKTFKYNIPEGFNDEKILSPVSYLLDKMIKELTGGTTLDDLERETSLQFLALNSNT
ncbi:hypothetical protein [Chitinophaga sp. Ak27]|uniref:hypothetical protein n=1 Tax=Chitinophaga sp. Ak27 TaxID=2726116 RepID=UPI00145FA718|nr:hypothetical protein [Chitinophaga sp. Ak27]NLU92311.1 hypothetical protein [Chitinophaga sp. Ak27]